MHTMKLKQKHIYLTVVQEQKLKEYSNQTGGLSVSEIIRRAIDEYLERRLQNVSHYSDKSTEKSLP